MVGFDMDHTLIPYIREEFEALAFRETLKKLINKGYPDELEKLKFKPLFLIRGLLVDSERGNVLRVDAHKYVKDAYHGYRRLTKEQRHNLYNSKSFKAQNFVSIDTFFSLSEIQLYTEIIDYMDLNPKKIQKSFKEVYADIRKEIDLSHQDGSIKNKVMRDPERYIKKDKHLSNSLVRLLHADKSMFLLTNSHYDYTSSVMSYVFDGEEEEFPEWKSYWDIIIVGAGKPGFFRGDQPFFEVQEGSGLLLPHDGPMHPEKVYHGGNAKLLETTTGYHGDEILYVGDHIYGDILHSKDSLNWRTLLIIHELEDELRKLINLAGFAEKIQSQLRKKEGMDELLNKLRTKISFLQRKVQRFADVPARSSELEGYGVEIAKLEKELVSRRAALLRLDKEIKRLIEHKEARVHIVWGELMKVGLERSRFANQVASYACLYTSRVSNLRFYSPFKKFVSKSEQMPHDE